MNIILTDLQRRDRRELGDHMAAKRDLIVRQPPLALYVPKRDIVHARDDERVVDERTLEPLQPIPRHVLQHDARAFGNEDEVTQTVHDDGAIALLDDVLENAVQCWW